MRRFALFVATLVLVYAGPVSYAQSGPVMLDDLQVDLIKKNCLTTQSLLGRIHANDGLLRVNLGRQYEVIATRLMAPLNSRIALAKLDNVEMTKTTVDYNQELEYFRAYYQEYEQMMADALAKTCQNQPVAFYDTITAARIKRQTVHDSTIRLQGLAQQYGEQFDVFSDKILAEKEAVAQ